MKRTHHVIVYTPEAGAISPDIGEPLSHFVVGDVRVGGEHPVETLALAGDHAWWGVATGCFCKEPSATEPGYVCSLHREDIPGKPVNPFYGGGPPDAD